MSVESSQERTLFSSPPLRGHHMTNPHNGTTGTHQTNHRKSSFASDPTPASPRPPKSVRYADIDTLNFDTCKAPSILEMNGLPSQHRVVDTLNIEDSPQLLATSVGAEIGSQLVPSISNISLLSLNQQPNTPTNDSNQTLNASNLISAETPEACVRISTPNQRHMLLQRGPNNIAIQHAQYTIGSRKSSFHSPTLQGSQLNAQSRPAIRRPSSSAYQQQQQQSSLKQPIQIRYPRGNIDGLFMEPDSPVLNPISLSGSPSNFLLSHSSPPNSLKSSSVLSSIQLPLSRFNNTNTQARPSMARKQPSQTQIQSSQQQHIPNQNSQLKLLINKYTDDSLPNPPFLLTRENSISESIGGRSPELAPVSTTLPPMTPLILSMPLDLGSRSNSNVMIDDDDDDDDDHGNRSVIVNRVHNGSGGYSNIQGVKCSGSNTNSESNPNEQESFDQICPDGTVKSNSYHENLVNDTSADNENLNFFGEVIDDC